jgi:hypothetical protein
VTLHIHTFREAYRLAHAAGWDECNRQMQRDGRTAWNADDRDHAVATFHRVLAGFGYAETGSRRGGNLDTVPLGIVPHQGPAVH